MSVSARDRKAVIYSEVERQRDLLDQKDQQLRAQDEETKRLRHLLDQKDQQLRDAHEELARLRISARPQAPKVSERRAPFGALKAFATKYRCTARWHNGAIELYSRKRGCWVVVPEGTQP